MAATHSSRAADPFATRNLWLAGLGLAAITRREAGNAVQAATRQACRLRGNVAAFAGDARDIARGVVLTLGERAAPAAGMAATWLSPVLPALGKVEAAPTPVKVARKKTPVRRQAGRARR